MTNPRLIRAAATSIACLQALRVVVVFGHVHREYDLTDGARRFLNPGSVGCHDQPEARALVLTPASSAVSVAKVAVKYEDAELLRAFEERQVPWRDFILRTFIRWR